MVITFSRLVINRVWLPILHAEAGILPPADSPRSRTACTGPKHVRGPNYLLNFQVRWVYKKQKLKYWRDINFIKGKSSCRGPAEQILSACRKTKEGVAQSKRARTGFCSKQLVSHSRVNDEILRIYGVVCFSSWFSVIDFVGLCRSLLVCRR